MVIQTVIRYLLWTFSVCLDRVYSNDYALLCFVMDIHQSYDCPSASEATLENVGKLTLNEILGT